MLKLAVFPLIASNLIVALCGDISKFANRRTAWARLRSTGVLSIPFVLLCVLTLPSDAIAAGER
mgnify:CR=1 FL=1